MRNEPLRHGWLHRAFRADDPKVERITTYSGADRAIYARLAGGWQAVTKDQEAVRLVAWGRPHKNGGCNVVRRSHRRDRAAAQ